MEIKTLIKEIKESRRGCLQGKTREEIGSYYRGLADAYEHILRFLGEDVD